MPEPIFYQLFGPKTGPLESPQEKIYREGLRDIRNIIRRVENDLKTMAEKECQEKADSRS